MGGRGATSRTGRNGGSETEFYMDIGDEELQEIATRLRQNMGDLSTAQKNAADKYFQSLSSFSLNGKLRRGADLAGDELDIVLGLDSAMKRLPANITAVRMCGDTFLHSLGVKEYSGEYTSDSVAGLVGMKYSTPQFTSVSAVKSANVFGNTSCEIDMRIKKGTKAFVNPHRASDTGHVLEGEVLLPRNVPCTIVGAWVDDVEHIRLVVEVG